MVTEVSKGGVLMTGSGTGTTGAVTVSVVQDGYLSPTVTVGGEFFYVIKDDGGNNLESGIGTWTATTPGIGVFSRNPLWSTDGAATGLNLSGNSFNVYMDVPLERTVFKMSDGKVTNADAIIKSIKLDSFAEAAALATPTANNTLYQIKHGTTVNDGRGGFFEWIAGDTSTQDDHTVDVTVNIIKLTGSTTGRLFRRKFYLDVFNAADSTNQPLNTIGDIGSGDAKALQVRRSLNSVETDKKIPEVEGFHQNEYITFAQWKAVASTKWKDGDTFVFRGITGENDLGGERHTFVWDASNTDTASLDITTLRPDDIAGSNPGRAVLTEPAAITKFTNSDATPSLAGGRFHKCADIVPAAITALDGMVDLRAYWIFPGAQNQVFTHGASLLCPGGTNFTLRVGASPIMVVSDNGIVTIIADIDPALYPSLATLAATGGAALIGESGGGTVQEFVNSVQVSNYTALKAVDVTKITNGRAAVMTDSKRGGVFRWDTSNLSAQVTADPSQGIYIPPNSDTSGASGAWVRHFNGAVAFEWFDSPRDGVTTDSTAFAAFLDSVDIYGFGSVGPDPVYLATRVSKTFSARNIRLDFHPNCVISGSVGMTQQLLLLTGAGTAAYDLTINGGGAATFDQSEGTFSAGAQTSTCIDPVNWNFVNIDGCRFDGADAGEDYTFGHGDSGITPTACNVVRVTRCRFFGFADVGIYYTGGASTGASDDGYGLISMQNYFERCAQGISVKRDAKGMASIGDVFRYNQYDIDELETTVGFGTAQRSKIIGIDSVGAVLGSYMGRASKYTSIIGGSIIDFGYALDGITPSSEANAILLSGAENCVVRGVIIDNPNVTPHSGQHGVRLKNYVDLSTVTHTAQFNDIDAYINNVNFAVIEEASVGVNFYNYFTGSGVTDIEQRTNAASLAIVRRHTGDYRVFENTFEAYRVSSIGFSANKLAAPAGGTVGIDGFFVATVNMAAVSALANGASQNVDTAVTGLSSLYTAVLNPTNFGHINGVVFKVRCTTDLLRITVENQSGGVLDLTSGGALPSPTIYAQMKRVQ